LRAAAPVALEAGARESGPRFGRAAFVHSFATSRDSHGMSGASALVLVAVSARALAASARRAGFAAIAVDAFGDVDTCAACRETVVVEHAMGGFATVELESVVARLSRRQAPVGIVYGSGFDDCPSQLVALARHAPLIGCSPQALARTKDPMFFAEACAQAGLAHPEIRFTRPTNSGWLIKRRGGSGGLHVAPAPPERDVAQRRVAIPFRRRRRPS